MKTPTPIYDSLLCLTYRLEESSTAFEVPEEGFEQFATLINHISYILEESGNEEFVEEKTALNRLIEFLIQDQELGLLTSVYRQFSDLGQALISGIGGLYWDQLLHLLRNITDPESNQDLEDIHDIINSCNESLKDLTRENLLDSAAFRDPVVLGRANLSSNAVELGFANDAALRAKNLTLRPNLFSESEYKCSLCSAGEEPEVVSGKSTGEDDCLLRFPGRLGGKKLEPIIDTGGGANLVKASWLRENGFMIDPDPQRHRILLNADGTTSEPIPCMDFTWSFDGRNKIWTDVEFIVTENFSHDALLGMPFLKLSETIHNKAGRLVFPEYKNVHAKASDAIPLYGFGQTKAKPPK